MNVMIQGGKLVTLSPGVPIDREVAIAVTWPVFGRDPTKDESRLREYFLPSESGQVVPTIQFCELAMRCKIGY